MGRSAKEPGMEAIAVYIWQGKCGAEEYLTGYETTGEHIRLSGEFILT